MAPVLPRWCRVRSFLIEAFMCHTHNAAWHTLHNVVCGGAGRMGAYLDAVDRRLSCKVAQDQNTWLSTWLSVQ